jgi:hypothetical protein
MRALVVLLVLGIATAITLAPEHAAAAPVDANPLVEVVEDVEPATAAVPRAMAPVVPGPPLSPSSPAIARPPHAPASPPPVPPPER